MSDHGGEEVRLPRADIAPEEEALIAGREASGELVELEVHPVEVADRFATSVEILEGIERRVVGVAPGNGGGIEELDPAVARTALGARTNVGVAAVVFVIFEAFSVALGADLETGATSARDAEVARGAYDEALGVADVTGLLKS
jgi:hypothetical protein